MVAYAAKADVYKYALARGALGNPGRIVDSAPSGGSVVTLTEHGFATGDVVFFRAPDGGALASPLVAEQAYYVVYLTDSEFSVSATSGGSTIAFTSSAVSMVVWADLPFDALCEYYSRFVDGFLPAEAVPLAAPYPVTVVAIVATLVGKRAQILSGMKSESMDDAEAGAAKQLERWAKGLPLRDKAPTQVQTNLAITRFKRDDRIGLPLFRNQANGLFGTIGGGGGSDPPD